MEAHTSAPTTRVVPNNPSRSYNLCPQEIWEYIFKLACVDGGTTGRSLSLVSKDFRVASQSARFHSVAIDGDEQAVSFASLIRSLPPDLRCVRHFFISQGETPVTLPVPCQTDTVRPATTTTKQSRPFMSGFLGAVGKRGASGSSSNASVNQPRGPPRRPPNFHNALLRILILITCTLETLTIVVPPQGKFYLPSAPLTALEELTIYGEWYPGNLSTTPLKVDHFPMLRFLHLSAPALTESHIFDIVRVAPPLTHLRLSVVGPNIDFPGLAKALVGRPSPYKKFLPIPPRASPKILVLPWSHRSHLNYWDQFELDRQHNTSPSFVREDIQAEVVFLPSGSDYLSYGESVAQARDYWQSRMKGRLGCWDESNRASKMVLR